MSGWIPPGAGGARPASLSPTQQPLQRMRDQQSRQRLQQRRQNAQGGLSSGGRGPAAMVDFSNPNWNALVFGQYQPGSPNNFTAGGQGGASFGGGVPQFSLDQLVEDEANEMQRQADQHYNTLAGINEGFARQFQSQEAAIEKLMAEEFDFSQEQARLDALADASPDMLEDLIKKQQTGTADIVKDVRDLVDTVTGETTQKARGFVEMAIAKSEAAVEQFSKAAQTFKDEMVATASAAARGVHRRFQNAVQQIGANPNLSAGEKQAMRLQAETEAVGAAGEAMAPIVGRASEIRAQLNSQVGQAMQADAQVALAGANMEEGLGRLGLAGAQALLGAGNLSVQAFQAAANAMLQNKQIQGELAEQAALFRQSTANMKASQLMAGTALSIQGHTALANMVASNRPTFVSRLEGYLAVKAAEAAERASSVPAINVPAAPAIDYGDLVQQNNSSGGGDERGPEKKGTAEPKRRWVEENTLRQSISRLQKLGRGNVALQKVKEFEARYGYLPTWAKGLNEKLQTGLSTVMGGI